MTNLNSEIQLFFEKVKRLREELELGKKEGKVDSKFSQQMKQLEKEQLLILDNLLPDFQKLSTIKRKTHFDFYQVVDKSHINQEKQVKKLVVLKDNLLVILLADGSLQLIEIIFEKGKNYVIKELGEPIVFSEKLSHILLLDETHVIVISKNGVVYLGELKQEETKKVEFIEIAHSNELYGLYEVSEITKNTFFGYRDFNEIKRLVFDKEMKSLKIENYRLPINCIEAWSTIQTLNETEILLGDDTGNVVYMVIKDKQLFKVNELTLANGIRKFGPIEFNEKYASVFILGEQGNINLIRCDKTKLSLETITTLSGGEGSLFFIAIQQSNVVTLSDSGDLNLLENRAGHWELNVHATIKEAFYTQVYRLENEFLFINSDDLFEIAKIEQVDKGSDLLKIALYE